ncbi:hypothetical protein Bca52824_024551 [Brassica carinata]|uniref:Uncharacterized protein n=1 Tax=Brassica carinata TaxID=52824 RepID=A0A8X7VKP5_BRACI|nr:hypothetical protein Bca52824_024551 [Brassica carinata]
MAITSVDDLQDRRLEQTYFPLINEVGSMEFSIEGMQKEIKAIQRQLASRPAPVASIDRRTSVSIDGLQQPSTDNLTKQSIDTSSIHDKMIQRLDSMQAELSDLSEHAYEKLGWHELSFEGHEERIQRINDELIEIKKKRTREYEATRSLFDAWFGTKADFQPNLTFSACLGAWYTWDRMLQTSLEGLGGYPPQNLIHKNSIGKGFKQDLVVTPFKTCFAMNPRI